MKKTSVYARRSLFWGLVLVLAAAALILEGLDVSFGEGFGPLRIALGIVLLAWLVSEGMKKHFAGIFFPLAFLFMLFEAPLATRALGREDPNLINNWIVLLAALLLTVGVSLLTPSGKGRTLRGSVGTHSLYFDAASDLADARVSDNLGTMGVYITNRAGFPGSGRITVTDNLGQVTLHLPGEWRVILEKHDNLGAISIPPQDTESDQTLTLVVKDNLGHVRVKFN